MKKIWLVFKHEYLRHVLRKRFLFSVLSIPFFMLVMIFVSVLAVRLSMNFDPVGYIDQSGLLDNPVYPETAKGFFADPEIVRFESEESALAELKDKKIQAYVVLSPDYMETGNVRVVALESSMDTINDQFREFLRMNLLRSVDPQVAERLTSGGNFIVQASDNSRSTTEDNILGLLLPMIAGIIFMVSINITGGYLLQALVEEKENRTMEIIITSVSPNQLMTGKILGDLAVGFTQLGIWILTGGLLVGGSLRYIPFMQSQTIDPSVLWLMLLTSLPAYILVAALMATVGASATESREAQQVAGLFTLPLAIPLWFMTVLMMNPNGAISIGLSLFPLTAPIALPIRAAYTSVPTWQIALTLSLLVLCAVGALWLAGKVFRIGMLQYGKRLKLKDIFQKQ